MRFGGVLAACILVLLENCGRPASSLSVYQKAHALREQGDLKGATALLGRAMAEAGGSSAEGANARLYWLCYLESAEITQQQQGNQAELRLLSHGPPDQPAFHDLLARQKLDQGWAHHALGNDSDAEKFLGEAYALARSARDEPRTASIEFAQAQVLTHQGRYGEAEARISDARARVNATGSRSMQAYGLHTLARFLIGESRFEDALRELERENGLTKAPEVTRNLQASLLIDRGWCHYRLGELDRALAAFGRAKDLAKSAGDRADEEVALGDIGNVYLDRRDYPQARGFYERALAIAESRQEAIFRAKWLSNLARVAIETRDWENAAAYNRQALELESGLNDRTADEYALVNSARIAQGHRNFKEAVGLLEQVTRDPKKQSDSDPVLLAHAGLAEVYAQTDHDTKAAAEYQAALGVVERTRSGFQEDETKLNFLSNLIEVHQNYIDFLMSRGKTERALEVAEASRARILQERLGDPSSSGSFTTSTYRAIARESGSVLLSYWLGPRRSYVWITTADKVLAYPLPPEDRIREWVEQYRALIENVHDPLTSEDGSGAELYRAVLLPVIDRIPPGSRVIIAPDASLHALNFETLPVPSPKPHYFLEDAVVSLTPSLNLLAQRGAPRVRRSGRMLMIGDPDFNSEQFPKLPYAAKEIASLAGRFPPSLLACYRKQEAAPAAYRGAGRGSFSYVHFTAHAFTNPESPLDSAILLSGPGGDNRLTAREVMRQPLDAELVTISACRSAGARTYAGEGLVGFMWAFFRAGVQNIIAGLWDVSDDSTPQLMDTLYAHLLGDENPADALNAAKKSLLRQDGAFRLPYYWAPFQLYIRSLPEKSTRTADMHQRAGVSAPAVRGSL